MSFGALPPIDQSLLPADIRTGTPARRNAYEAASSFEQQLVQQLTQSLADSTQDAMGGDSPYASMLPDALAQGVMDGGGLGLARQLTDAIAPPAPVDGAGTTTTSATAPTP